MGGPRLRHAARKRRNQAIGQHMGDLVDAKMRSALDDAATPAWKRLTVAVQNSTFSYAQLVRTWVAVKEVPVTMLVLETPEGGKVVSDARELRTWRSACTRGLEVTHL